jgi:hypothetical protein
VIPNLHLLKKELSVSAYEEVMPIKGRRNTSRWQQLPDYVIARCPFCLAKNIEKIDTYSLLKWYGKMAHGGVLGLDVFDMDLVIHHCQHFALVQKFFSFSEVPEEAKGRAITEDARPYVIGHLLESGLCRAVIHALPICRIEGNEFIPSYTLVMISYFSQDPPDATDWESPVYRAVHRYNSRYYQTWESSTYLYLPLGLGEPHWGDLSHWVSAGQLYWVDASDQELNIKTHDITAFPYRSLADQEE